MHFPRTAERLQTLYALSLKKNPAYVPLAELDKNGQPGTLRQLELLRAGITIQALGS
jgi:hypothetical protein